MTLRKDLDDLDSGQKGDWCFLNNDENIAIRYGDDPFKHLVIIPIAESSTPGLVRQHWEWNGNKDAPSLTPSILVKPYPGWNEGWHGYLTDGKLITV